MNKKKDKNRKNKDGNRKGGAKSFVKSLKSEKNRAVLARLAKLIARYRGLLILSIALAAISVVLQLYVPILFGDAIDELIAKNAVDFNRVWFYLKRVLVLAAASALSLWAMSLINNKMTFKIVQNVRSNAIEHIQKLPLSYLDKHSTGIW